MDPHCLMQILFSESAVSSARLQSSCDSITWPALLSEQHQRQQKHCSR